MTLSHIGRPKEGAAPKTEKPVEWFEKEVITALKNVRSRFNSPEQAAQLEKLADSARRELIVLLEMKEKAEPTVEVEIRLKEILETINNMPGGMIKSYGNERG